MAVKPKKAPQPVVIKNNDGTSSITFFSTSSKPRVEIRYGYYSGLSIVFRDLDLADQVRATGAFMSAIQSLDVALTAVDSSPATSDTSGEPGALHALATLFLYASSGDADASLDKAATHFTPGSGALSKTVMEIL